MCDFFVDATRFKVGENEVGSSGVMVDVIRRSGYFTEGYNLGGKIVGANGGKMGVEAEEKFVNRSIRERFTFMNEILKGEMDARVKGLKRRRLGLKAIGESFCVGRLS